MTAYREAVGQNRFWGGAYPPGRELVQRASRALLPGPTSNLRKVFQFRNRRKRLENNIQTSVINPAFAKRVDLARRLETLSMYQPQERIWNLPQERARAISHPYLTVGVERYDRVASSIGIEPRHPFLDRRLVEHSLTLPGAQKMTNGWPKTVLRRAMAGRLPDEVCWRQGKEHLGWAFTSNLMATNQEWMQNTIERERDQLGEYIRLD